MKSYDNTKIKNIAIAGHAGSGKTTLVEALLYSAGVSDRFGKVADGNTVSDYTAEEIARKCSVYTSLSCYEKDGFKVNLLDTPGLLDFEQSMVEGISACGCCMITVSGKSGVKVGTHKAYNYAKKMGKPAMFVVTKLDDENANFNNIFTELKTEFGPTVCPVVVPVIADRKIVSYVNLIEMKAYKYENGKAVETDMPTAEVSEKMEYRIDGLIEAVSEAIAETDEALMEKFFEGEPFTHDELVDGIHNGLNKGLISPVVCVSAATLEGIDMLMKEITLLLPAPAEKEDKPATDKNGDIVEITSSKDDPLTANIFKTVADPFVGKMSYIRVQSGVLKSNSEVVNSTTGASEKIGKLYFLIGKKQIETSEVGTGDICAAVKLSANTGDTLCDASRVVSFEKPDFPKPTYRVAVRAASQNDESKISNAIARMLEEDMSLTYTQDPDTFEMILSTLGGLHLETVISKLKRDFGVDVVTSVPKIAYKETIRKKVKVQGRHKKQSGGHGQFGDVWIEFEPCISDELIFEERVFGGAVPKNYFPAVEKGLQECVKHGVLAGYPVVGVKAILVDGSYHPVDSSEMAFKTAASIAFRDGIPQAEPMLLEPVGNLEVTVPDDNTGDVIGELNKRRGRVMGMVPSETEKGMTVVTAEVPIAEMSDFTLTLRQMTQGQGSFTLETARYDQLPANLVTAVIAASKTE
ncbi:MAG: elongation factor G [Ruminococcus sp.]|nr:elongation factor G [Ruminococcus sp.]